jgi:PAS domain-containing protein
LVRWFRRTCCGHYRNVTSRKQAEEEIKQLGERNRDILKASRMRFSPLIDWRFTYVNSQAERLLDRIPGDLIGKVIWDEYPGWSEASLKRLTSGSERRLAANLTAFYPDHQRWYEPTVTPLRTASLSIFGM